MWRREVLQQLRKYKSGLGLQSYSDTVLLTVLLYLAKALLVDPFLTCCQVIS